MTKETAVIIKEILDTYSLSQSKFASIVKLDRRSIRKYLSAHNIHPKALKKIIENFRKKMGIDLTDKFFS